MPPTAPAEKESVCLLKARRVAKEKAIALPGLNPCRGCLAIALFHLPGLKEPIPDALRAIHATIAAQIPDGKPLDTELFVDLTASFSLTQGA